jgi:hypothetical protein
MNLIENERTLAMIVFIWIVVTVDEKENYHLPKEKKINMCQIDRMTYRRWSNHTSMGSKFNATCLISCYSDAKI